MISELADDVCEIFFEASSMPVTDMSEVVDQERMEIREYSQRGWCSERGGTDEQEK